MKKACTAEPVGPGRLLSFSAARARHLGCAFPPWQLYREGEENVLRITIRCQENFVAADNPFATSGIKQSNSGERGLARKEKRAQSSFPSPAPLLIISAQQLFTFIFKSRAACNGLLAGVQFPQFQDKAVAARWDGQMMLAKISRRLSQLT